MIYGICAFTDKGRTLLNRIKNEDSSNLYLTEDDFDKNALIEYCFTRHIPIIFIGATGIAVRLISSYVCNKLTDSAVIVIDELGKYVIPILSGHAGGANDIACYFSCILNASSIITTATDINDAFSVDVFARRSGLCIRNKEAIKKVSSKILKGDVISMYIADDIKVVALDIPDCINMLSKKDKCDVVITLGDDSYDYGEALRLTPKEYILGIGCKKNSSLNELIKNAKAAGLESMCNFDNIYAIASIDIKKMERCLNELSCILDAPFVTYTADKLMEINGAFSSSAFVLEKTGTDNVCERAAMLAAGKDGELVMKKVSAGGFTYSLAKRKPLITSFDTKEVNGE